MLTDLQRDGFYIANTEIAEHMFWITQHRKVLDAKRERPAYLAYAKQRLDYHIQCYLEYVRVFSGETAQ